MEKVAIDTERLPAVESLLAQLRPGDPATLAGLDVLGEPASVAAAVDPDRLMVSVRELARSPREPVGDPGGLERALTHIENELGAAGLTPSRLDVTEEGVTLPVVHVTVPARSGTRVPTPTLVLTSHYDTVPGTLGADDDASGVAAVLEIARLLPRGVLPADVVLAAVPFEEPGSFTGAHGLATYLSGRPQVELLAAISAEMVGFRAEVPRVDGDNGADLFVLGYPGSEVVVDTICAAAAAFGGGAVRGLAVPVMMPDIQRSDHSAFAEVGVPAVMATDGAEYRNPHYHRPTDTPDTLDPGFLAGSTRTLAVGLMALATRLGGS